MQITNVVRVLARCWETAERKTRSVIARKYYGADETQITFLFRGELRYAVAQASDAREFEHAFLADIRAAFPQLGYGGESIARGLIASVNFHNQKHEAHTSSADLGLVLTRPDVNAVTWSDTELKISHDVPQALLAQAKLGKPKLVRSSTLKWGGLTKKQRNKVPDVIQYHSLLLYRYGDKDYKELKPFGWQLCQGYEVDNLREWLRQGCFPEERSSEQILLELARAKIGTNDRNIIERIVDPHNPKTGYLEIRISWGDGKGPGSRFVIMRSPTVERVSARQI
jgi:hypothetical protein